MPALKPEAVRELQRHSGPAWMPGLMLDYSICSL
jgi:hypothetical protein